MDWLFVRFVLKSFIHIEIHSYLCNFTVHVLPVFGAAIQVSAGKNDTKYNVNFRNIMGIFRKIMLEELLNRALL